MLFTIFSFKSDFDSNSRRVLPSSFILISFDSAVWNASDNVAIKPIQVTNRKFLIMFIYSLDVQIYL